MSEAIFGIIIQLGKRLFFFRGGDTPFNCGSSVSIAENKYCMNKILNAAGFPVPKADAFSKAVFEKGNIESLIKHLSFPLVVKPTMGTTSGNAVLCNIGDVDLLKTYMEKCYQKYDYLSVEEFHPNLRSYRVLVFYNKVIGVVERFPASVVGDGIHSIKTLIDMQNIERENLKNVFTFGLIKPDEEYNIRLKELNMTFDSIPKDKQTIVLCYTCNATRGGTTKSLGKKIGRENARLFCQASKALDLNLVGFDVECEDILIPLSKSRGVIIEANHNPAICIHENPMSGIPRQVAKIILRKLIYKHPISYCVGLYQNPSTRFYVRLSLLALIVGISKVTAF